MAAANTPDHKSSDPAEPMFLDAVHASAWSLFESARRAVLPFDVLSHIFLDCLPDEGFPTLSVKEAPLVLGRVCSYWREVALATPLLWAGLQVRMEVKPTHDRGVIYPRDLAPAVQEWISRAGRCSLSYHLSFDRMADDLGMELLNVLLPHRRRWKHIQGCLTAGQWRHIFSALAIETPPLLEYLNISSFHHPNKLEIHLSANWILRTLFVNCRHDVFGLETCGKSLRHISVDITNLDECLFYFVHCPNLEAFEVQCGSIMEENFLDGSDVACLEMKRLDKLTLKLAYIGPLVNRLCCPSLRTLHIVSVDTGFALASFLRRSHPPLVSLSILARFGSEVLLDCLRHTPALISLTLRHGPKLTVTDLSQLQLGPETDKNVSPSLTNIHFYGCLEQDVHMKHVEDMIVSRWKNNRHVASSGCVSAPVGQSERSLPTVLLECCYFADYVQDESIRFIKRPERAKCIEEGLLVREKVPGST